MIENTYINRRLLLMTIPLVMCSISFSFVFIDPVFAVALMGGIVVLGFGSYCSIRMYENDISIA